MSSVSLQPCFKLCFRDNRIAYRLNRSNASLQPCLYDFSSHCNLPLKAFCVLNKYHSHRRTGSLSHRNASAASTGTAVIDSFQSIDVLFKETYPLKRTLQLEGNIYVRLDHVKDSQWELTIGCNSLPGKWILHWGVSYINDVGSEWDQPPMDMRPPGSIPIKDYAIETPMKETPSLEGGLFHEVKIAFSTGSQIAAIHFVLKDEENGAWFQHKGRAFKVPLVEYLKDDANAIGARKRFGLLSGALRPLSNLLTKEGGHDDEVQDNIHEDVDVTQENWSLEGFYEELPITKYHAVDHSVSVSVRKCLETPKYLLYIETDVPGDVVVHWGVCRGDSRNWELPLAPYPPDTAVFRNRALRTPLKPRDAGEVCGAIFTVEEEFSGLTFVLKLHDGTWFDNMGEDFYIPLSSSSNLIVETSNGQLAGTQILEDTEKENQDFSVTSHANGIIDDIRNLTTDITSVNNDKQKSKEAQENILQEIEKLAAEAYNIFRSSIPTFSNEAISETEKLEPPSRRSSGTGSGFEILCQGFNWESNKSGRWYMELKEKAAELASFGFTVIWLPPPTESVSPEGYMPKDLYNLNSRYGNMDELKDLVESLHSVGIKVLGDVVLNHRCAHYQNQNGVWNMFGGRLNWDDRAVVGDDPHFQGRGNKSSGDNFHAAPNIDHSQEFIRNDLKEWLRWLRQEIGYDGWRLDFVRGFWGGYVKDYLDATEPYFAVGEFWDSLSYTYNDMDYNQDAHRQRIIDWINATNGTAGAFDVTTKGILHSALERCEYWRLSDENGKPPGVLGWWPSRAVTFIENHDTGSTQGHWRFPGGKEMQGYAYILTHPGTPSVFYDHLFSHYQHEIASLISLRKRSRIHCRSQVEITKAERDVYAAIIDEKLAVKIGPGYFEPPSGLQIWTVVSEGSDYKIWQASQGN